MQEEIWKDVVGFEGMYQVSDLGRVRGLNRITRNNATSTKNIKGKLLTPYKNDNGYMMVCLSNPNYNKRHYRVHRLVAEAFLPNPHNYTDVNHKDEMKHNNNVTNLEWCNRSYNSRYGTCQERLSKHKQRSVVMCDKKTGKELKVFDSMKTAMKETGLYRTLISRVCRGERKTAGGYIWKYAD